MNRMVNLILFTSVFILQCRGETATDAKENTTNILTLEMHLSAFGVESDNFPSADVEINFSNGTSKCRKHYFDPKYKDLSYSLNRNDIDSIFDMLKKNDLKNFKKEYQLNLSDQPSSTIIIYTNKDSILIKDYGLKGDYPLQELYKIAYKL